MFTQKTLLLLLMLFSGMALLTAGRAHAQEMTGGQAIEGLHDMKGIVTAVNHRSGEVGLDAGGLKLKLHFPPPALLNVEPGDTMIVRLGIKEVVNNPSATKQ